MHRKKMHTCAHTFNHTHQHVFTHIWCVSLCSLKCMRLFKAPMTMIPSAAGGACVHVWDINQWKYLHNSQTNVHVPVHLDKYQKMTFINACGSSPEIEGTLLSSLGHSFQLKPPLQANAPFPSKSVSQKANFKGKFCSDSRVPWMLCYSKQKFIKA